MMEFLLQHTNVCWELRGQELLLYYSSNTRIGKNDVESYLQKMAAFVSRVPEYLLRI